MINEPKNILKRAIIDKIEPFLGDNSIIVLHGARQVGKTHIMYYLQQYLESQNKICKYIDLEDQRNLEILDAGVDVFIKYLKKEELQLDITKGKTFIFIDEIQYLTNPSSFLKLIADHHREIQLIVSGSSSFEIKSKFKNSLVGRTINFEVFNLSFKEFLMFKSYTYNFTISDKRLRLIDDNLKLEFKEYLLYGGFPQVVLENSLKKKELLLQQIIQTYIQKDIIDLAKIKDTKKFNQLIKVLASQNGQLINVANLSSLTGIAKNTIDKYLFILENTYILKLLPGFSMNAKVELSKAPKIFFYDTGIVQLLTNRALTQSSFGNLFENSIFLELVKNYGQHDLYFWRTKHHSEIDFILDYKNLIIPIEVKNNFNQFRNTIAKGFVENYNCNKYFVIGLEGELKDNYIYPWDIDQIIQKYSEQ
jgi:uncharacterized protein